jgi:hypothetical protein
LSAGAAQSKAVTLTPIKRVHHLLFLRAFVGSSIALRFQLLAVEVASSIDRFLERVSFPSKYIIGMMSKTGSERRDYQLASNQGSRIEMRWLWGYQY